MTDRVVIATCRTRLQADVLKARLASAGIPVEEEGRASDRLIAAGQPILLRVPVADAEEARAVVASMTGRETPTGLFGFWRLLLVILFFAVVIAVMAFLVDLLV